ncbi:hypothetical protein [Xanthomonas prunicola]|uniref:hypothetical protein n=1 Tax=Xanthomonas prunicola TaxID=2053930 RepID=UPI0010556D40|nr:hypothetical protein [Xanthomonas prunicola]
MKGMNGFLRLLSVPICAGFGTGIFFLLASIIYQNYTKTNAFESIVFFGIFGGIMGAVVGCPMIILVEWKGSRLPFKYVLSAIFCAIFGWLLIDGAFAKGALINIWGSSHFWLELAPRRFFLYSLIGLISGLLYTLFVLAINKLFPPSNNIPD